MARLARMACAVLVTALLAAPARAQPLPPGWDQRDLDPPAAFTRTEIQMLQDALIWTGHYNGLKDGGWGQNTDRSLQNWRRANSLPTGLPMSRAELLLLFRQSVRARADMGWTVQRDPNTGFWFGYPARHVAPPRSHRGQNEYGSDYNSSGTGQMAIMTRVTRIDARLLVEELSRGAISRQLGVTSVKYRLDRPDRQVVSFDTTSGLSSYVRFDRFGTEWRGFILTGRDGSDPLWLISPVSAEFTGFPAPTVNSNDPRDAPLIAPVLAMAYGERSRPDVANTPRREPPPETQGAMQTPPPAPRPPEPSPAPRQPTLAGSGTAFVIRTDGSMLTNAHVVQGCASLGLPDGTAVTVVAADDRRDLALVRAARTFPGSLAFRRDQTIDHGERVHVFGFPYYRLVSESLNITEGIVTALTGVGGSTREFQLSANMQPGNSGGPVLDGNGRVIGVAVAVLNALNVARVTGTIPQGMNYAIRGQIADAFLLENGVISDRKADTGERDLREIAREVGELVLPLLCFK